MSVMQRPFVIHLHRGHGPSHYDLMLLYGEALACWRLDESPAKLPVGRCLSAQKLPDHRAAYLTYEGPVSGRRGEVTIVDRGTYDLLTDSPDRWEARFNGQEMAGRYELLRLRPQTDAWNLRRLPDG